MVLKPLAYQAFRAISCDKESNIFGKELSTSGKTVMQFIGTF